MRYSFDPAKQKANLAKHGFDLSDARQVIESNQLSRSKTIASRTMSLGS